MSLLMKVLAVIIVVQASAHGADPENTAGAACGWDMEKSAHYLDARLDLWIAKATKVQTGGSQSACISCHTVFPYLLARPFLRQAMHVSTPTPQEERLLRNITERVEAQGDHAPLFAGKQAESDGTEAVLNALILACNDASKRRTQPGESTQKAFRRMWATQREDGAWDWLDFAKEPNESADAQYYGAALAAVAVGMMPAQSADNGWEMSGHLEKLRTYLNDNFAAQNLHQRVWMLLASLRLKGLLTLAQRAALIAEIQEKQNNDGGWSLYRLGPWRWSKKTPPFAPSEKLDMTRLAQSDGYATGLLTYALRQADLPADASPVKRAIAWLKANQKELEINHQIHKGWISPSLNHDSEHPGAQGDSWRQMIPSDSATPFAVLALLPQP
jgi:squalene-hopene/tetraprenyl-beta-curcumene cyclase